LLAAPLFVAQHDGMVLPDNWRLPRDPEKLLREVDAAIRIKDIKNIQRYRDRVELKWWESGIVILLFISGLGFMITIYKLLPSEGTPLFWFVFFWFALFTITLVAAVEFLLAKIAALRSLYEINARVLDTLEKSMSRVDGMGEQPEAGTGRGDEH
jgi:hypothetical protein